MYVVALGMPVEEVTIEDAIDKDDIKYYRDENRVHHVPKRTISDLLV